MKKIIQIITLSLLVACFTEAKAQSNREFSTGDYKGLVTVNSTKLIEEGEELHVVIEVWVNGRSIQNYAGMRLTPKIFAGSNYKLLPDIMIQGGNKRKTYDRWLRTMSRSDRAKYLAPETLIHLTPETDTVLVYDVKLPYELWMDDAVLALNQEMISYRDQRSLMVFALGGKVELESKEPYTVKPLVSFATPKPEQKSRKKQGQAFLDFAAGRSEIVATYRRNPEELAKIEQAFKEIVSNPDVKVNGLFIEGYASPEGKYEANDRLSHDRANALKHYIVNNFSMPINHDQIRTASVAEDWHGLRSEIEASNIVGKDQILTVIDSDVSPDMKEARLKQIPGTWQILMRNYFPQLRRVEYQIDFTVKDFTIDEAKAMIGKNDVLLSQLELYTAAQSYDQGSVEFENIMLEIIPRLYRDDATATINAAAVMIRRGEIATAKRYLEKYADNPAAWNNLGVIYMLEGDLDRAAKQLENAAASGVTEAKHNIAEIEKKRADNAKMERFKR